MQKNIIKIFWDFSSRHKVQRALAFIFPVIAVSMNTLAAPYVLSKFIDKMQRGTVTLDNSWGLLLAYAALIITGEVVIWRLALYFTWTFEINGQRDLYVAIFKKLTNEDIAFHANRFGGSLVSQSNKMISSFERFWDMLVWSITPMLTTVTGAVIILSVLGLWQYALFLVIYAVVFGIVVYFGSRFLAERNRQEATASNKQSGFIADTITNITTVKAFGKEKQEVQSAQRTADTWLGTSNRLKWGVLGATSAFSGMYAVAAVIAFLFAILASQYGIASIGMVYLVFVYALNINRQLWELNNITRTYNRIIGDAHEMTLILNKENEVIDHSAIPLVPTKGLVRFDDVEFSHDNGDGQQVFKKFNLTIQPGQRVGLVGHSGSGKTTLTRILLRFSDIGQGAITIDGQDIKAVTQQSLHESIAYVPQEPLLFHRSLRENIAYGREDATNAEIEEAAQRAHALDFIYSLPEGFDTMVGERGIKLSGGQRQRIAIARAILKNAPILVLDEATSALDSESEKLIQASLDELMKGRTSIVIAHRLSTIAKLDRIIVLENGAIAEDGTHAELLSGGGIYANLWSHQSGGFIEE